MTVFARAETHPIDWRPERAVREAERLPLIVALAVAITVSVGLWTAIIYAVLLIA